MREFENGEDTGMEDLRFGHQIPRETDKWNYLSAVHETVEQTTEMFEMDRAKCHD